MLLNKSSEKMRELSDNSVHLVVTSPPYNVGKAYERGQTWEQWLTLMGRVFKEIMRVLVPGGRVCINVANTGRNPYIPLHFYITNTMLSLGFLMRGEIIWDKGPSVGGSTAWGSWMSAVNPTLRDVHEYILVFSKKRYNRLRAGCSTIARDEFLVCTKSVWRFPSTSAKQIGHPAPFPQELPRRLIALYSFDQDTVLDPFCGSGQTGLAALTQGRKFVGYEIVSDYCALAKKRMSAYPVSVQRELFK
jgi:modification methylase